MKQIHIALGCRALAIVIACMGSSIVPSHVYAQNIPSSVDAGRMERRLSQPPAEALKMLIPEAEKPAAEAVEIPPGAEKVHFVLRDLVIQGGTVYPQAQLRTLYADKLNKQISLADVYSIAGSITQLYRHDGYILSHAIVPPQKIDNGKVTIVIIEGYVEKVIPDGTAYRDSYVTRDAMRNILAMRPLNSKQFERIVLLLNDLAGISVHAIMEPMPAGEKSPEGTVAARLVFEKQPDQHSLSVDNYGTRYVGPMEETLTGSVHGILIPYDRLTLSGMQTSPANEMRSILGFYTLPVNASGLAFITSINAGEANPGYRLSQFDLVNRTTTATGGMIWDAIRQRSESVRLGEIFSVKNIRSSLIGQPLYDDRIRTLRTSVTYEVLDKWSGSNSIDVGFTQGLNILNASTTGSSQLSHANGHSDFSKVDFTASRLQDVTKTVQAFFSATGQFSDVPLLSAEQFGYGGQSFGRAYDPSEIVGDDGLAGAVELRYNGLPSWKKTVGQPFVFYDIGQVWNLWESAPKQSGASAGLGTRINIADIILGTATVAKPLTRPVASGVPDDGNSPRFFFSLTAQF